MTEGLGNPLCTKCFGVGHIEIKPDQVGMLHRPELEQHYQRSCKVRIYEHGDGTLEAIRHPYRLRVLCPKCNVAAYKAR